MDSKEVVIFWFRRDLRLNDNRGLHRALSSGYRVLPLFIYDREILLRLEPDDARVSFICDRVAALHAEIKEAGGELLIRFATAERVFMELPSHYNIKAVYTNRDYEPYAIKRDAKVEGVLKSKGISFIKRMESHIQCIRRFRGGGLSCSTLEWFLKSPQFSCWGICTGVMTVVFRRSRIRLDLHGQS
jgi:deoxyribodipyrimidine photolyase